MGRRVEEPDGAGESRSVTSGIILETETLLQMHHVFRSQGTQGELRARLTDHGMIDQSVQIDPHRWPLRAQCGYGLWLDRAGFVNSVRAMADDAHCERQRLWVGLQRTGRAPGDGRRLRRGRRAADVDLIGCFAMCPPTERMLRRRQSCRSQQDNAAGWRP